MQTLALTMIYERSMFRKHCTLQADITKKIASAARMKGTLMNHRRQFGQKAYKTSTEDSSPPPFQWNRSSYIL